MEGFAHSMPSPLNNSCPLASLNETLEELAEPYHFSFLNSPKELAHFVVDEKLTT